MVAYERPKPLILRVPTVADVSLKIQRYGSDNLYPQTCENIIRRSSSLKSLYNRLADFINGEGFSDPILAAMVVNRKGLKGQTLNKVLQITSHPFTRYYTKVFHVGYNGLGQMCELNPLPFETVRFATVAADGHLLEYGYSPNFEMDGRSARDKNITFYPVFNPDPAAVVQQIEEAGGIAAYRGQIIYDTPEPGQYPVAAFDAVLDDAQVQGEVGLFKIGNVQNSFLATLAILYPGEFGSIQEELDFKELIANKSGSRNAGTRIGLQDKTGQRKASDIFQTLQPTNLDKIFEYTERSVKENIIESEAFPAMLLGKTPSGLFAQGDMEEAYTYVNAITRNRRAELSEFFSLILSYWETPVITDAAIIEQRYVVNSAAPLDATNINTNLKDMSGRQEQNFTRILRKYMQGKYDRATAETLLSSGFGLSAEEIKRLLDGMDAAAAEDVEQLTQPGKPSKVQAFIIAMSKEML